MPPPRLRPCSSLHLRPLHLLPLKRKHHPRIVSNPPSLVFVPTDLASGGRDDLCAEQIKLVHYPHPVAFKYEASPAKLDQLLNPPRAALSKYHEEAPKDTSYYYTSTIAGKIYTRWQSQVDACIQPLLLHPIKSHVAPRDFPGRFAFWKRWFSADKTLSLCSTSTNKECAGQVQGDIKRYLGRTFDPRGQVSLFRWDLERPRYVSKRPWIMNSTTRALVRTIVICVLIASVVRLCLDWRARGSTAKTHGEYIPLATE